MASLDIFTVIAGVIGIMSFLFSGWVWMKSDTKIRELRNVINTVHDISSTVLWEENMLLAESHETRLRQADKTIGYIMSLIKLTEHYSGNKHKYESSMELDLLIDKGIIWTNAMIGELEMSPNIKITWLITPDFQPDSSQATTGKMVNKCIKKGNKYVFFYPDDLPHVNSEIDRLMNNIGLSNYKKSELDKYALTIPLNRQKYTNLFDTGNTILFFFDTQRHLIPRCFSEISLTRVPERGVFWQEHTDVKTNEIRHILQEEYLTYLEEKKNDC
ncbi:hypothetical protein [Candidatus Albibeggiatoa sp. nov. BB20]|uniref:hypothetical protein n=1 Tax=Candidatus Albibeggiatoa sp. nov. BB20 TaxID=3162723 RepID=UPI0033656D8F